MKFVKIKAEHFLMHLCTHTVMQSRASVSNHFVYTNVIVLLERRSTTKMTSCIVFIYFARSN